MTITFNEPRSKDSPGIRVGRLVSIELIRRRHPERHSSDLPEIYLSAEDLEDLTIKLIPEDEDSPARVSEEDMFWVTDDRNGIWARPEQPMLTIHVRVSDNNPTTQPTFLSKWSVDSGYI